MLDTEDPFCEFCNHSETITFSDALEMLDLEESDDLSNVEETTKWKCGGRCQEEYEVKISIKIK